MIKLLLRIGLVRRRANGTIRWPVSFDRPGDTWIVMYRNMVEHRSLTKGPFAPVGLFRNRPGVIKWEKDRLLPRRWGFHFFGLEIGDRG